MDFSFGADPEFLLMKDSKFYSATEILRPSRKNRLTIGGHQFFHDNVMAECAIKPSNSKEEALENFRKAFGLLANLVKPYKLVIKSCQEYSLDQLVHPGARKVGCATERCPYINDFVDESEIKNSIENTNFRSAGGHVHLGAEILRRGLESVNIVKMLDIFVGIPLLFIDHDKSSVQRRKTYGKAGRHRRPAYGLEYRTPGNCWLASPKLVLLMYNLCEFTLDFANKGGYKEMCENEDYNTDVVQCAINYHHALNAIKLLMKVIKKYLPESLFNEIVDATKHSEISFYEAWDLI